MAVALSVPGLVARPAGATGHGARIPPNSVTAYGSAMGSGPDGHHAAGGGPFVDIAPAGDSGYWVTTGDGTVSNFGTAPPLGSLRSVRPARPVVGISSTPSGDGYWLVAEDGGVFAFGDAGFHGSLGGRSIPAPVVAMAGHPSGLGYWLVDAAGSVHAFGAARSVGSVAGRSLPAPVVGLAPTPAGEGYWLAAADGAVFAFGDATHLGSADLGELPAPITDIAATPDGDGYRLLARDGVVHHFGVGDKGSPAETAVVDGAATGLAAGSDDGYWVAHGEALPRAGETGAEIRRIQRRLTSLGYWLGRVDGVYGPLTEQAVYAFQKVEGLPVTGRLDPVTRHRLTVAERPKAASPAGDLVEVDKTRQVLFVVRGGQVAFAFNASAGGGQPYWFGGRQYRADTPSGQFVIHRQADGVRESRLGRLYRPKYFHPAGIAIHGFSFVPPYAASHGCVRLRREANDFLWSNDLVPVGSAVAIYGQTPAS
jgi:peptidoglycan hydrolase-like protein with peptidoglycan-binding domain